MSGEHQAAIDLLLSKINKRGPSNSEALVFQFGFYLFLLRDYKAMVFLFETGAIDLSKNREAQSALVVAHSRLGNHQKALNLAEEHLRLFADLLGPLEKSSCFDGICSNASRLGLFNKAKRSGETSLNLKNQYAIKNHKFQQRISRPDRHGLSKANRIISFSLFGNSPRYLRGAIENIVNAEIMLPDWACRFYLDVSVPRVVINKLEKMGAEIILQPQSASLKEKLSWRFQAAWDPSLALFLIRDVDSVISNREVNAINDWISSDRLFHIMRDWWTHTDLILAGMWGGVGGTLPDLSNELQQYEPQTLETPNIDQWFLRDRVWPLIHEHCLTHDRCFNFRNSIRWPSEPIEGHHVGQNAHAVDRELQLENLEKHLDSKELASALAITS